MTKDTLPSVAEIAADLQNDKYAAGNGNFAADTDPPPMEGALEETKPTSESWNNPPINTWRYLVTLYCLFTLGANDASIGVCAASSICHIYVTNHEYRLSFHTWKPTTQLITQLLQLCFCPRLLATPSRQL
jgi:hypothetical protein